MTTRIFVHTCAASAVRHACDYGWTLIEVDTSTWPEEERELLASSVVEERGARYGSPNPADPIRDPIPFDVTPPTEEGLRASLQLRLAERAAKAAQRQQEELANEEAYQARKARVAARLEELRQLPTEELVVDTRVRTFSVDREVNYDAAHLQRIAKELGVELSEWNLVVPATLGRDAEVQALLEERLVAREQAQAEQAAEREAAEAAEAAARAAWIAEHGSPRLVLGVAQGFSMTDLYWQERFAYELPSWYRAVHHALHCDGCSERSTPDSPSELVLCALASIKTKWPEARLEYYRRYSHDPDNPQCDPDGDVPLDVRPVCVVDYLGEEVYLPVDEVEQAVK
jgi:hypothetical protein